MSSIAGVLTEILLVFPVNDQKTYGFLGTMLEREGWSAVFADPQGNAPELAASGRFALILVQACGEETEGLDCGASIDFIRRHLVPAQRSFARIVVDPLTVPKDCRGMFIAETPSLTGPSGESLAQMIRLALSTVEDSGAT